MKHTKEAREVTQAYYGGYCLMCRNIGITPAPYSQFKIKEHERVKNIQNAIKRKIER